MGKRSPFLAGSHNPRDFVDSVRYKLDFRREHPGYFDPEGLLVFCGPQGSGKTLSAVQYCQKIIKQYPGCLFCSNVEIAGVERIHYEGISSLSDIQNGYNGVLYLIDEIHLEWNSLESKNISIEEMTEFAQQRKQRKHIVGTSQVYMRLAKPLREQIKNVVLCENYFGLIQHNKLIDGLTATEENGKLQADVIANYWWLHRRELYSSYDTFAKMQRYSREWKGRKLGAQMLPYEGLYGAGRAAGTDGSGSGRRGR